MAYAVELTSAISLEAKMDAADPFSEHYNDALDGSYDCVDRVVLNGYFIFGQSPGGFRAWWRDLFGSDETLDDTHLMRLAGRFSRRLRAWARKNYIPVIDATKGERMHPVVQSLRPPDPDFAGVFCITVHRGPNSVWSVKEYGNGGKDLRRKSPAPYVNHYAFHIIDRDWGHLTIKICGHAPFNVQVLLNGHEYVARQARRQNIAFTQEGNCFTETSNLVGLSQVAETLCHPGTVGRLRQVCERWIYTACVCYVLNVEDQKRTDFRYSWSNYQLEYSRNLLFTTGREMEEVFQSVIDRTRRMLNLKTIRTIFGRKTRLSGAKSERTRVETVTERPAYDLTVFKVHFGLLTLKIYTKGGRVLRVEAIVHNAKKIFTRGYSLEKFPQIVTSLHSMVDRFLEVLRSVDSCWISDDTLNRLPEPSQVGLARVAGVDLNRPRMRAVIKAVLALSSQRGGFRAEQVAAEVREIIHQPYTPRHASYDLKKLRAKNLLQKIEHSRRYESTSNALKSMVALVLLREKVIAPILAGTNRTLRRRPRNRRGKVDRHYEIIRYEMQKLFTILGLAA
jgi:hypothetical protein